MHNYPKNYDLYIPTHYDDIIKLTKTNIKEIKNIYSTIVGSLTKKLSTSKWSKMESH